jgi:hypothetical protein
VMGGPCACACVEALPAAGMYTDLQRVVENAHARGEGSSAGGSEGAVAMAVLQRVLAGQRSLSLRVTP